MSAESVRKIVGEGQAFAPEPPRPLQRELPPPEPYPIGALGAILGRAARAIQDLIRAPAAICAQSVLAACTLAVQAHADVLLPHGQVKPTSQYFVSIADSGDRKTAADNAALAGIRTFEGRLHQERRLAVSRFEGSQASWEAERRSILSDKKLTRVEREAALIVLGAAPEPPLSEMLTCPEPTFEGLTRLFATTRPSLGLFSDEGGQFVGGFGMGPDQRLKTAAGLSTMWDGQPLRRVRVGDGNLYLPGRRLSMHLLVQPNVAGQLLGDPLLSGQGLLSRLLVVAPVSEAGTRFWRQPNADSQASLAAFEQHLLGILEAPLPLREGTNNELEPRVLRLSERAKTKWIEFADHIEERLGPNGELVPIKAFGAKVAEHAVRLAAVLTLTADLSASEIQPGSLDAGIVLAEHYVTEWLRFYDAAVTRPEIVLAQKLLDWLLRSDGDGIGLPEIYQKGPNPFREAKTAREAMTVLEEHGWVVRIQEGAIVDGMYRRDAWRIVRE